MSEVLCEPGIIICEWVWLILELRFNTVDRTGGSSTLPIHLIHKILAFTVFINEGIKMDKCPKNMTLVALNILTFFKIHLYPFLKLKDPQIILLLFSFLLCGGQAYFYIFVFGLLGSTTGRGPHFLIFLFFYILWDTKITFGNKKLVMTWSWTEIKRVVKWNRRVDFYSTKTRKV